MAVAVAEAAAEAGAVAEAGVVAAAGVEGVGAGAAVTGVGDADIGAGVVVGLAAITGAAVTGNNLKTQHSEPAGGHRRESLRVDAMKESTQFKLRLLLPLQEPLQMLGSRRH